MKDTNEIKYYGDLLRLTLKAYRLCQKAVYRTQEARTALLQDEAYSIHCGRRNRTAADRYYRLRAVLAEVAGMSENSLEWNLGEWNRGGSVKIAEAFGQKLMERKIAA